MSVITRPAGTAPISRVRVALAVLVPIGPLAVAVLRVILPYYTVDPTATMLAKVAGHQGAEAAVLWLSLVAMITLVPATIAVGLLAVRRRPWLGGTALVVSLVGFAALPVVGVADDVALAGARSGLTAAEVGRLLDVVQGQSAIAVAGLLFVVGHILGVVLLGIALWRAGVLPGWAGLLLSGSQPLHAFFALVVPNHLLDSCAWGLTAVGFALAASVIAQPR
jgi:hypothetical protein